MSQNYKDTLNRPRTDFAMQTNLAARELEFLKTSEETRLYEQVQKARKDAELFVLHDIRRPAADVESRMNYNSFARIPEWFSLT